MVSFAAYALSAWCYCIALVIALWIVPHLHRFSIFLRLGVLLFAAGLVFRGIEMWSVAGIKAGNINAELHWFFVNSLAPLGATLIIIGKVRRLHAKKRKRAVRSTRITCSRTVIEA